MKTIFKLRKSFFASCIMVSGALASPEYCCLRRHSRRSPIYSCAGLLRPRLVSTLPFAAPRIFDNCINRHQPAGRPSHAPVGRAIACPPASHAAAIAVRRPGRTVLVYGPSFEDEPSGGLRGQLLVPAMNFVIVRSLAGEPLKRAVPSIGRPSSPKRLAYQTNLIP
jgi:hypothetical protein